MSWLDSFFSGVTQTATAGVVNPKERILNFASGFALTDNAAQGRTDVTIAGAGGAAGGDLNGAYPNPAVVNLSGGGFPAVTISVNALTWTAGMVGPTLSQATPVSDVVTQDLTMQAQAPFASASTNKNPGSVKVTIPTSLSSNTYYGGFLIQDQASTTAAIRLGDYGGPDRTYAGIWFRDAGAPNGSNFGFLGNQSVSYLNVPSGGSLHLSFNGTAFTGLSASAGVGLQCCLPVGGNGNANTPFQWKSSVSFSLGASGTTTLTAAQSQSPALTITSTSQSGDVTLDFGTNGVTGYWVIDVSGITLNGHNLILKNGTASRTYAALPTGKGVVVITNGANTLASAP